MVSENRVKELVLEALKSVKESEPAYQALELNDETMILGAESLLDSIAFTHFVVGFEEKMEDALGESYVFELQKIYDLNKPLTVASLSQVVAAQWQTKGA